MNDKIIKIVTILGVVFVGVLLFLFNPQEIAIFPKCPFLEITGWQCAGCGSQRAIHKLLHLNFKAAWSYNQLLVLSIPYLMLLGIFPLLPITSQTIKWRKTLFGTRTMVVIIMIIIAYTFARNII